MSALKMILPVGITLETTIQKAYQNHRNLRRKYLWRSVVVVKEIFLWFTVILLMILKLLILKAFV